MGRSFLFATGIACVLTFALVWFATGPVQMRGARAPEAVASSAPAPAPAPAAPAPANPPPAAVAPSPEPAGPPPAIIPDPGPPSLAAGLPSGQEYVHR